MTQHANIVHQEWGQFEAVILEKSEGLCIVRVIEPSPELRERGVCAGWPIALTPGRFEIKEKG